MRKFILLFFALLMTSCAIGQTRVYWILDPEAPNIPYQRVLLDIDESYQDGKVDDEVDVIKKVRYLSNTEFIPSHVFFLPTREYSKQERRKLLKDNGIEAIILVTYQGGDQSTSIVPVPTFHTTTGTASGYAGSKYFSANTTTATSSTAWIPITTYNLKYKIDMIDLKRNKSVWYAATTTNGDGYNAMRMSLISQAVKALCKSGLIIINDQRKCSFQKKFAQ